MIAKTLRSTIAAAAFCAAAVATSVVTFPSAASATPADPCFLMAGCSYIGESWVCPDPKTYADCVTPAH